MVGLSCQDCHLLHLVLRRYNAALKDLIGASFGQTTTTQQLLLSQHDTQYGGDGGGTGIKAGVLTGTMKPFASTRCGGAALLTETAASGCFRQPEDVKVKVAIAASGGVHLTSQSPPPPPSQRTPLPPQFNNTVGLSPTPPVPAGTVNATVLSTGGPTWGQGGNGGGDGSPHRGDGGPHVPSERYVLPSGASSGDAGGSGGMYDTVSYWLRYSSLAGAPADSSGEGLGSFYQVGFRWRCFPLMIQLIGLIIIELVSGY